jgi:ankyrin repeat protein
MFCTKVDVIFTLEKSGFNSLIVASMNGYASTVTKLIEYGLDVNYESHTHWTALLVAIRYMHFPVADILIKHGANVNAHDGEGRTLILDPCHHQQRPQYLVPHQQRSKRKRKVHWKWFHSSSCCLQ